MCIRDRFYCGDITIEALDLEHLLDDLVDPSCTHGNGGVSALMDYACLCVAPYGDPNFDPNFPILPTTVNAYTFDNLPHYTNSLIDHIDNNYVAGTTTCDHYYQFSNINGNQLTGTFFSEGGNGTPCEMTLEFQQTGFGFEHIISFSNIRQDPNYLNLGINKHFLVDAQVVVGSNVVTVTLNGHTDCFPIVECFNDPGNGMTLCENPALTAPEDDPCVTSLENTAINNATNAYTTYLEQVKSEFIAAYTTKCLSAIETFEMEYLDNEYHYTLYYYDQAGNLVKTVPPEGVEFLTDQTCVEDAATDRNNNNRKVFTKHRMATDYQYNSLNQLVTQHVPDHDDLSLIHI